MPERQLLVRVVVDGPPPGVDWALQLGRDGLVPPTSRSSGLEFETSIRVVTRKDGALDLRGPAVQGPLGGRFIYLTSGVRAGQFASCWNRRAKVPLEGLLALLSRSAGDQTVCIAVAAILGTARDGGPACASVPLTGPGWRLEPRTV